MGEQDPKAHGEETEREETMKDLDVSEEEGEDVKGGFAKVEWERSPDQK
jgi:hypothetical protein